MIRRPPRSTQSRSSAASDVYKRQHLHGLGLGLEVPPKALGRACWLARLEEELAPLPGVQARIARELVARCRTLSAEISGLGREIAVLTEELAPEPVSYTHLTLPTIYSV